MGDAHIRVVSTPEGGVRVALWGRWTLAEIAPEAAFLQAELLRVASGATWDCREIEALDSAGAMLLWRAWGRALPPGLLATPIQLHTLERIAAADAHEKSAVVERRSLNALQRIGSLGMTFGGHFADIVVLIGQVTLDFLHVLRHPGDWPWREISANIYKSGVRAMPIAALVGFLIGVVLSYLSALQLRRLGAETFIVDVLGMGLIREIGPVLIAVLVAGRSGSAMTAQLGVMKVTEEIDALAAMGVPRSLRLIFPKVAALALAMPLLVLWITFMALLGGMVAADIQLDVGLDLFIERLPKVVPVANLWIGLAKGVAFGVLVALVACHFGLRARPNTESLSAHTTASVVTSITVVILIDAAFAIVTRSIGVPT
jgi:phospholipid/cholesterol/gamma-HCH transport system permease protein